MEKLLELVRAKAEADAVRRGVITLGTLIDALRLVPAEARVSMLGGSPGDPQSYRGYYDRMAFATVSEPVMAGSLLALCEEQLGGTLYGYKGGEYPITRGTLLHAAEWGDTGLEICGIEMREGAVHLRTQEEEW